MNFQIVFFQSPLESPSASLFLWIYLSVKVIQSFLLIFCEVLCTPPLSADLSLIMLKYAQDH